jgi:hypothetical protein
MMHDVWEDEFPKAMEGRSTQPGQQIMQGGDLVSM